MKDGITPLPDLHEFLRDYGPADKREILLFRGQDCLEPLLPKIARRRPEYDSTDKEKKMLFELRRFGSWHLPHNNENDWDLMARAQHFGMATRLLDWTSNPLVAIWFAVKDLVKSKSSYLYSYHVQADSLLNDRHQMEPFDVSRTMVYRPSWNNPRVTAQAGWFSVHVYSKVSARFVALERNKNISEDIDVWEIQGKEKHSLITDLSQLGVNYQTMFPDLEGVCRHINWLHDAV